MSFQVDINEAVVKLNDHSLGFFSSFSFVLTFHQMLHQRCFVVNHNQTSVFLEFSKINQLQDLLHLSGSEKGQSGTGTLGNYSIWTNECQTRNQSRSSFIGLLWCGPIKNQLGRFKFKNLVSLFQLPNSCQGVYNKAAHSASKDVSRSYWWNVSTKINK